MHRLKPLCIIILLAGQITSAETQLKETRAVPMRDGVLLAADIYRPSDSAKHPVLLYRTRYNKNSNPLANAIPILNYKGYVCVVQDTRGRYSSAGIDSVFFTDGWGSLQDGYDTIEWLTKQSWCNGKIGMLGASADGIATYRAAGSLHPALKCAVTIVAATDFYHQVVYPGGEYQKSLCEGWLSGQNAAWMIQYYLSMPYYNEIWQGMNFHTRSDSVKIPMLHIGGWYDVFAGGPVAAYTDLVKKPGGTAQNLIMGPWTHGSTGNGDRVGDLTYPNSAFDIYTQIIVWFDHWLLGNGLGALNWPAVQYYLMGDPEMRDEAGCIWMQADTWPPQQAVPQLWFLADGGRLTSMQSLEGWDNFSFSPQNPVPTVGGNNLTLPAGPFDQRSVTARADVLTYISEPLTQPLRVEGHVKGVIYVSSDAPDTDITLKLIDLYPDGRQILVTDGISRLRFRQGDTAEMDSLVTPGRIVKVTVSLPPTAIVFNSGHRILAAVSSSNYQRFEINPNTGAAVNDRTHAVDVHNTIHRGTDHASCLKLPVVQGNAGIAQGRSAGIEPFHLYHAFPNPFNASTSARYQLDHNQHVTVRILNVRGQTIKILLSE